LILSDQFAEAETRLVDKAVELFREPVIPACGRGRVVHALLDAHHSPEAVKKNMW
jgi:hypothetical protein